MRRGELSQRIEGLIADVRAILPGGADAIDRMTSEQRIRRIHELELKAVPPELIVNRDVAAIAEFIARLHRWVADQLPNPAAMLPICKPSLEYAGFLLRLAAGVDSVRERVAAEARDAAERSRRTGKEAW